MLKQAELLQKMTPLMQKEGRVFLKKVHVLARRAQTGETIRTFTSDGEETHNQAKKGDYVIRNLTQSGEEYILSSLNFKERYQKMGATNKGFSEYKPIGKVYAIELTARFLSYMNLPDIFKFEAPWGEPMVAKKGDFLASPEGFSEIYRIAKKEFGESYVPQ